MSAKSKLTTILTSKASLTTHKFTQNHYLYRQKTAHTNKYASLPAKSPEQDLKITRDKLDYRHRNQTEESKHNRISAATIELRNRMNQQRQRSFSNSKSLNLKQEKYLFQPQENFIKEDRRDDRLLQIREEKLGRIKQVYNLKNRMNTDKRTVPSILSSNPKFNSFKQFNKKDMPINLNKSKEKPLFTKNEDLKEKLEKNEMSERSLPRFFDYCEIHSRKEDIPREYVPIAGENSMPQALNVRANKVKSMKEIPPTPPLLPVTFKKRNELQNQFDPQWVKQQYQPHLEIFQQISMDKFIMKRLTSGFYFGELNQTTNIRQGKGFIFYQNGKIFEGHFVNDDKEGLGYELYPDSSYYLGNFKNGKRAGKGRFQWNNGEVYEGEWVSGKKQGSGIWKGPEGLSYVGEWHHDIIQGFGVLVEKNTRYQGEFKNFMKWGNGTIRFQNGQTYTGMFRQNLANGIGDYYWTNGDHYHGEFANGKRHGQGILKYVKGGIYRGLFQNDKKSGKGQQTYDENLFYEGEFQNDLRHGWGLLYCEKRVVFEGYWLNNTALDPKKGKIETIIEQQQSIFEKDTSKNSNIKKIESNATLLRNKILLKKQEKIKQQRSLSKDNSLDKSLDKKPFRRACNCERHRLKYQMLDS